MSTSVVQPAAASAAAPGQSSLISRAMVLLALAHLLTDLYSSAVATLQPLLSDRLGLSLTQAGLLGGVFMLASSVLQLPFGLLSDRLQSRLFSVVGPLVAGIFLSSLGLASDFPQLLLLTFIGGMGVAAFHPQSTKEATRVAGARRGLGVAVFITAGTFGLACGPLFYSGVIELFGFDRLAVAMAPALIVCSLLLWKLPVAGTAPRRAIHADWTALKARWRPLALHYSCVVVRSTVQLGVGQFLTLYLVRERLLDPASASLILALFFLAASLGSFLGGNLADRIGGKRVVMISMIGSAPFYALFLALDGWLSIAALFLGGLFLLLTIPVNVVMAQELVPEQAGAVSALMMGFAWGVAGITFVPFIGWLADRSGLETVLWGVAMLPLIGFILSLRLPPDARTVEA